MRDSEDTSESPIKLTQEEKEQLYSTQKRWHVVAFVVFKDGRTGIKVLPVIVPKILNYYNAVSKESSIERIELYATNDTFFNRFPSSSALRVHYIDRAEAEEHLKLAERLACDGRRLVGEKHKLA